MRFTRVAARATIAVALLALAGILPGPVRPGGPSQAAAGLLARTGASAASFARHPVTTVGKPRIHRKLIPFGSKRRHEMSRYSKRHYGRRGWRLKSPKTIVEHYAVAGSIASIFNTFAPDHPDPELGELPNVCSHFAVSSSGRIYQFVSLRIRCRHTVGLNDVAIGIEHVGFSDADVMGNRREREASLRLTRWLRCRYDIPVRDVIGHNESLASPYHHERVPALKHQTHGDMKRASMHRYRHLLRREGPCRIAR